MSDPISYPFLKLEGVTKRYGGVTALANVDFACSLGTIHAVVGENGAGKSSLMKIVAGVIRPDEGRIYLDGKPVHFASPADATRHGIACIFQELSLLPDLSVSDNISIADPPRRFGLIDRRRANSAEHETHVFDDSVGELDRRSDAQNRKIERATPAQLLVCHVPSMMQRNFNAAQDFVGAARQVLDAIVAEEVAGFQNTLAARTLELESRA